ncbi:MAG: alpha/beta hydrolase [Bacteroidota bacterium]
MQHPARLLFKIIAGTIIVFLLFFVTVYFLTKGEYPVKETISSDASLPQDTINDAPFHVKAFGNPENPVIIFVHGGPGFDFNYLLPLETLKDSFYLVFYDQAGCGLSPRYDDPELSFERAVDDLLGFIRNNQNGSSLYLAGHSFGAQLSLAAFSRAGSLVQKVALIEPEFLTDETLEQFVQKTNYMRPGFTWPMLKYMITYWFRSLHIDQPDKHANQDYFYGHFATAYSVKGHPYQSYLCNLSDHPIVINRYGAVASAALLRSLFSEQGNLDYEFIIPGLINKADSVLFIATDCNQLTGIETQQVHQQLLPGSRLEIIRNSGYNPVFYQPEDIDSTLRVFFRYVSHTRSGA